MSDKTRKRPRPETNFTGLEKREEQGRVHRGGGPLEGTVGDSIHRGDGW